MERWSTWTPSVGSDEFAVLSASYDSSTFTSNTGSANGDKVICQAQNWQHNLEQPQVRLMG